ncbi:hypothetical protein RFI_38517 [Reticulomyxa filosa]|uniref:Uncharacterized protein n=1 Tax=Reticulomyxa filosa TaxID=46433 RepID=X6LCA8_RETFI|nr:hypothetical protein RFI_38517 [Reticulomyxa filosa]|eukprot:ETN98970.1 hypothetical protein RFI_38517 [Reticulomyxa filosa]
MPHLENLDFFRLTTPHDTVDVSSWACCLSAETIKYLGQKCPKLKKCQIFVKSFHHTSDTWKAVRDLLKNCPNIRMLTIGMEQSATFDSQETKMSLDKQYRRYFEQLKRVDWLSSRFKKFKKKTMVFPKFSITWCLLT